MIGARPNFVCTWLLLALGVASGCSRTMQNGQQAQAVTLTPQQQQQLAVTQQQMQQRATALDGDNAELEKLLAQSRQQINLLQEQVVATQDQLRATTERLASTQQESADLRTRTQAMTASTQLPAVGAFRPNNTLLRPLSISNVPGVTVRQDGDTIRVALASEALFQTGTPMFKPGADALVRNVASELLSNYPEHYIGIEGHTSSIEPASPQYPTPQHLSVAQATAVYDALRQSLGAASQQLFVIGQGANHPLLSNATVEGQNQNRRVELVVYPETIRSR